MLLADTLRAGPAFTIQVVVKDGTCAVINFIEEELQQAERMKVLALLESVAEYGPPRNEVKFRHEGKGIYALKTTGARLYGFFDGQKTLVLTHGFKKHARGGKKVQARERERAERIRELLLAERARKEGAG
jgi:mRNA-degrading endonuclease RelE of RelBE toxin-antitoxin system